MLISAIEEERFKSIFAESASLITTINDEVFRDLVEKREGDYVEHALISCLYLFLFCDELHREDDITRHTLLEAGRMFVVGAFKIFSQVSTILVILPDHIDDSNRAFCQLIDLLQHEQYITVLK
jgi:hypothetical protein